MFHMGDKQRRLTPDTTLANHFANEFWRLLACTNPFYAGTGMSVYVFERGGEGWIAEQLQSEEYSNVNSVPRYFFTSSI